jgi:PST family polysaccharide transporter
VGAADPEVPSDLTSTVVRGVSLAAAGYIAAQILNLGFYVALARLLEPTEVGQFAAATVLVFFASMISESGLASAVIQRRDRVEQAASTAVAATIVSGVLLSLLALALAPAIGGFFDSSTITALAAASAGLIFLRTFGSIPDALLQRRFSLLRRMIIEPATVVAFGVAAVIAASEGMGPWSLVVGQYVGFGVDVLLGWLLVRWRPHLADMSLGMWRELVGYGRHVLVATLVLHAGEQTSTAVVGRAPGAGPLGQFSYAVRLAATPFQVLLAGAAYVLFPAFARIADDAERLRAAFVRSLRWVCALAFPSGLVFVPLGVPLAVIVFGETWRPAGEALVAMCLFPVGGMLAAVVSEALKAVGQPRLLTRMHGVGAVVTIAAILALQPFGLTAAAASLSIGAMASGLYAVFLMRRATGIALGEMLREIWPPAVAATAAALGLLPLEALVIDAESHGTAAGAALLVAEALAGGVLYLALLAAIAPSTGRELRHGAAGTIRRISRRGGPQRPAPEPDLLDETLVP